VIKARPKPPSVQTTSSQQRPLSPSRKGFVSAWVSSDDLWIYLCLFVVTFVVYGQVRQFDFLTLDDPAEVSYNPHVMPGITPEGIVWAFTTGEGGNWMPLTRLSHMLDCDLFGLKSGPHHLMNVFLHLLATLLLFAFLNRATHRRWPSAFVAFLFALHPLHVESVAWVAERKDVLCALFWFLTLWTYVWYVESPGLRRYLLVLLSFGLGLLAKPMMVTLPFVLVLLDFWPLGRLRGTSSPVDNTALGAVAASWKTALQDKIPFFVLSAGACIVTYLVQRTGGAVKSFDMYSMAVRVENAAISYLLYIAKVFWPTNLAVWYPYPREFPTWQFVTAILAIIGISILVLLSFRARPYLGVGWFWFLGTLVPVIGLVQVGMQARADRYMYLPMVGLSIMLAWGAVDVLRRWPRTKPVISVLATVGCSACVLITLVQTNYWKTSESLFQHALNVTDGNYLAHNSLGAYLSAVPGRLPESMNHFEEALRFKPDYAEVHARLGLALANIPGRLPEAINHLETVVRIEPDLAEAHYNLGLDLAKTPRRLADAIKHFETALRLKPDYAEAHNDLGLALLRTPGRFPEAITHLETAIRLKPDYAEARNNLAAAHNNVAAALLKIPGRLPEAIAHFEAALRVKPDYAELHYNLGVILSQVPGRLPEAINHLEAAQRIKPDLETQQILDRLRAAQR